MKREKLEGHPLFEALTEGEMDEDVIVPWLEEATEEGRKVARNRGQVPFP